ncbi:MAG TPA: AMP-binding protein, partial [Pricia sp.]|nr:AMP-binding protein [Pricia sp.]
MQNISRLFDFPYYQLEKYNLEKSLVTKYRGKWVATSTQEYIDQANAISRGLLRMGIKPNDKIALISMNNRTEWNIMDIGILQLGAQNVPIYPTISEEEYAYVLNHSESIYCFVSCQEVYEKVKAVQDQVPTLKEVYSFDELSDCKNWKEVREE